ncbi:hypothetical protein DCAR_0206914 [Daucus carota subsp. sativus]|uniref:F-box domain-containing protein n=1 Tax=Daucus carota subsp. sativus TaxID=79200 RepID=A0AAF0WGF6_DAUCS|nr:hypothetical protein DCAR_0206914 [Daucus carota subsp. sativus]
MATMEQLPYELLYHIILLLVQSPGGAVAFARIISVCKMFLLFAEDKHILKLVNFDLRMKFKNFYRYQHLNSLLIKCSGAGNEAARFLLGKVILVSSSQLSVSKWLKVERDTHPCDDVKLCDIKFILATDVPGSDRKVGSFLTYFLPENLSAGRFSQTRLVHYQLVKLFLSKGSHHDFIKMDIFLRSYIRYFTKVGEYSCVFGYIKVLVSQAHHVRAVEKLVKKKELFMDTYRELRAVHLHPSGYSSARRYLMMNSVTLFYCSQLVDRCRTLDLNWREAINDEDFAEEFWRNGASHLLDKEYLVFNQVRAAAVNCFERDLYKFKHFIQDL